MRGSLRVLILQLRLLFGQDGVRGPAMETSPVSEAQLNTIFSFLISDDRSRSRFRSVV
jgi:hypothetical protein